MIQTDNDPIVHLHKNGLVAVSKPPRWLTVPGRNNAAPVLGRWLETTLGCRIFPVHRLDLDTSGIVLFADNATTHRELSALFLKHEIAKTYVALVHGQIGAPVRMINNPIKTPTGEKPARSRVENVWSHDGSDPISFCRIQPLTGRRHQIRIHLAAIGCPLLGDSAYGASSATIAKTYGLEGLRVALHSLSLSIKYGDYAGTYESPLWKDMHTWIQKTHQKTT